MRKKGSTLYYMSKILFIDKQIFMCMYMFIADETAENCKRFINNNGLELFKSCLLVRKTILSFLFDFNLLYRARELFVAT